MKLLRSISTIVVFGVCMLITYFLSDFYNDINDENRINFTKIEANTLQRYMGDALLLADRRGFVYSSALKTFPEMSTDLTAYRAIGELPGSPPIEPGPISNGPPPSDSEDGGPPPRPDGNAIVDSYEYIQLVKHEDRAEFERNISAQYNDSIQIKDYTEEVSGERDEYWVVYFHPRNTPVVGNDILSEPGRRKALLQLVETGEVSYTGPILGRHGDIAFQQFIDHFVTPHGREGVILLHNVIGVQLEVQTNILDFLSSGNGGRRLTLHQVNNNVSNLVYENGRGDELIYEGVLDITPTVYFRVAVFESTKYDNSQETLVFMMIGLAVSLVLATWEFFRSSASIRAEESSNAKSKFLSNISHEIRTPINGIVGISDVLSKEILSDISRKYVDIITSCSTSLLSLLNNVLDMSKIDAGKIEDNKKEFSMRTLVLRTVRDAWVVLVSKKSKITHISVVITDKVPLSVLANDIHLFQILNNLMSNAVKFTDDGYVEVKIDASEVKSGVMITMAVRDTGCGMSEDSIKKLFKPFNRIHNGNNEKDGTGLGLVISMALTKAMGGSITCTSELNVGTTFVASIIVPGEVRKDSSGTESVEFNRNETIGDSFIGIEKSLDIVNVHVNPGMKFLVVDDNKVNRIVLKKMLQSIGATDISTAGDGKESIEVTKECRFDLIFMDKYMPVMDGLDATIAIRKDETNPSRESPIVFLSADTDAETIKECIKSGANDFLGKPYRINLLIDKIHNNNGKILNFAPV